MKPDRFGVSILESTPLIQPAKILAFKLQFYLYRATPETPCDILISSLPMWTDSVEWSCTEETSIDICHIVIWARVVSKLQGLYIIKD
jgi:hypothetical protein